MYDPYWAPPEKTLERLWRKGLAALAALGFAGDVPPPGHESAAAPAGKTMKSFLVGRERAC
jgi:hypothetical protein